MADTTELVVNLFDGTRQPVNPDIEPHVQVFDGDDPSQRVGDSYTKANSFRFPHLSFSDNFIDNFRVIASARHFYDAGFVPLKMPKNSARSVSLMLIPKDYEFRFTEASWAQLAVKLPDVFRILGGGDNDASAKARYETLMSTKAPALACLLNIGTALSTISLSSEGGNMALSYYKEVIWDDSHNEAPQEDRFYAWAARDLIDQVVAAAQRGEFAQEPLAGLAHAGASRSYKQLQFGEANVQITFHENFPSPEGLVKVETDIDYYKNAAAHAIQEVIPNHFTKGKTNPVIAYALRWTAAREQGLPDFDPLFIVESKAA